MDDELSRSTTVDLELVRPTTVDPEAASANGAPPAHGTGLSRHRRPGRPARRNLAITAGAFVVTAAIVAAAATGSSTDTTG